MSFNVIQAKSSYHERRRVVDVHLEYTGTLIPDHMIPSLQAEINELPLENFLKPPDGFRRIQTEWTLDKYGRNIHLHAVDEPSWLDPEPDAVVTGGGK